MLYHANAIFSVFRVSLGCPVVSIQSRFDTKSFRYKLKSFRGGLGIFRLVSHEGQVCCIQPI